MTINTSTRAMIDVGAVEGRISGWSAMDRRRAPPPIASVGTSNKQKAPVGNDAPISKDPAVCTLLISLCRIGLGYCDWKIRVPDTVFQFQVQERNNVLTRQIFLVNLASMTCSYKLVLLFAKIRPT